MKPRYLIVLLALTAGCAYPATQAPPAPARTTLTLDLPYDLAWDAVHKVVVDEAAHIVTENPDAGNIELQTIGGFTTADADCGQIRGIGGKVSNDPDPDSSAVYDIHVEATAPRVSVVTVHATFSTALHVPLHPIGDAQCVSRGVQEARLLKHIEAEALLEHRPQAQPAGAGIRKDAP